MGNHHGAVKTIRITCIWRSFHEIEVPDGTILRDHSETLPPWMLAQLKPADDADLIDWWRWLDER